MSNLLRLTCGRSDIEGFLTSSAHMACKFGPRPEMSNSSRIRIVPRHSTEGTTRMEIDREELVQELKTCDSSTAGMIRKGDEIPIKTAISENA